jgi:UDP-glucose 4-epimerase
LDYRILRISNAYGPGHAVGKNYGAVSQFIYNAVKHVPIEIWGDGATVRDYVHVDDVVNALVLLLRHAGPSRTFNIGSGRGHSLLDLVSIIEAAMGEKVNVHFSEARKVDVANNVLDVSKAAAELGWWPMKNLENSIQEMIRGRHAE